MQELGCRAKLGVLHSAHLKQPNSFTMTNYGIYDVLYIDNEEQDEKYKYDYSRYRAEDEDHAREKFYRQYPTTCTIQEVIYRGEV